MIWQDLVFAIGSIVFSIALIPTLFAEEKPPLLTSLPTAFILYVFAITYGTLDLNFAAYTSLASASIWTSIGLQRIRKIDKDREINDSHWDNEEDILKIDPGFH